MSNKPNITVSTIIYTEQTDNPSTDPTLSPTLAPSLAPTTTPRTSMTNKIHFSILSLIFSV